MAGSFRIAEGYVEVTADESSYDRAMARLESKSHTVNIAPNMSDAAYRRVQRQLDTLTKDRMVRIIASADTRVAADEIRNLTRRQQVRIGIDVDTRVAADSIANLTRRRTMTVGINADTGAARARLDALTRDRHMNVRVDVDRSAISMLSSLGGGGGGGAGMGMLSGRIAKLAAAALGALPTLASLGQSIIAMGPAAAVAAPAVLGLVSAFAAIKIGTSGVGDAFKAAFAPAASSASTALSATKAVEAAQRSLAKAQQGVKDAEVNAAAARVAAARQIQDAQLNLKNTVSDVADANRRAAESVANAEQNLADAQRSARQAQLDLTQARKDAAQQLEDLQNQLIDGELNHRESVLRVQDAKESLDKTLADPKATQKQRDEAQLTYDQAVQHLKEQELAQKRLEEEAAAANKAGVEGSDQVTKAKQNVADANQTAADKAKALKDAEIEAARTAVDGAQKIAKAERDVADARAAATKAAVDGARSIADAQAAVADAVRAVADAQTSAALKTDKLGQAMAKLSTNAREFVQAVIAQGAAWRGLKLDVQDALFAGLGKTFTTLSNAVIPTLSTGLSGTATILNHMAKNAASAVVNLAKTGTLKQMFSGLNDGLKPLTRIPGQLITGLAQISVAASPAFKRLTTAAGGVADRFSKQLTASFKSGHLEKVIDQALDIAKQFAHLIGDIFGTLGNIMKAASAGGGDALGALGEVFKMLRQVTAMPEVQKALTSIFTAISAIAKLLAGTLGAVIQAALPLLAAMAPVVTQLATDLAPLLATLASSLGAVLLPVIQALLPVIGVLAGVLMEAVQSVIPLLEPIGGLAVAIVQALAPAFSTLLPLVLPVIDALVKALMPVLDGLIPVVKLVGGLLTQLAPIFPQLVMALLPLLPPITQLALSLINLAMQVLTPLMPLIVGLAGMLAGTLAGAIGILVPVLTTVIGWITKFVDAITAGVHWVVDKFQWLYDKLVGHSIIPDLVNGIVKWFSDLWDKVKKTVTDLKDGVVKLWNGLWNSVRNKWNDFWGGFKSAFTNAWTTFKNTVSNLKTSITNTWSSMWNGARDKVSGIFSTIRSKVADFKSAMTHAISTLRDNLGTIWNGIRSKFSSPIKFVIGSVYNDGIRRMWNTIASKISSKITLPAIKLGFAKGGIVPGSGTGDTVPAMLTPNERILSLPQVARLGGHRAIDAMLGEDRSQGPTGGNPSTKQEQGRQGYADGGIIGSIADLGRQAAGAIGSGLDWAKNLVVGGLKDAAQAAISSIVQPLINRIPGGGVGSLMKDMSNKALGGMLGFLGGEDKKAVGGPAVQGALSWARTQDGKPYQWGGNGNPSWDCSGFMSAIESVIRGESPHRRWATGSFSGSTAPGGWVRNLISPFQIGITNAGVGHTAGTIGGVNVESRGGGGGVIVGSRARGYNDGLFTDRYGFQPATKYDNGGLLQPGATMAINRTGRPERILDAGHTAKLDALLTNAGSGAGITVQAININGTFDFNTPASRKAAANAMVAEMKEALRNFDRERR